MLEGHEDVLRKLESDMEKAAEADDLVKADELQCKVSSKSGFAASNKDTKFELPHSCGGWICCLQKLPSVRF